MSSTVSFQLSHSLDIALNSNTMRKLTAYITILLIFSSCEIVLDVEIPEEPTRLVLNSVINPDSTIVVDLSEDSFILEEDDFTQVRGANIELLENGNPVGLFEETGNGIYRSNIYPTPGVNYEIRASKNGFESISGEFLLPSSTPTISTVDIRITNRNGYPQLVWEFEINDDGNEENFYEITTYTQIEWPIIDVIYDELTETFYEDTIGIDTLIYVDYLELDYSEFDDDPSSWGNSVLVDDKSFNGQRQNFQVFIDYWEGEPVQKRLVLRNCDETYFNYVRSSKIQDWNDGDPFAQPVFVTSNIENGYGLFSGYISTSITEEVDLN